MTFSRKTIARDTGGFGRRLTLHQVEETNPHVRLSAPLVERGAVEAHRRMDQHVGLEESADLRAGAQEDDEDALSPGRPGGEEDEESRVDAIETLGDPIGGDEECEIGAGQIDLFELVERVLQKGLAARRRREHGPVEPVLAESRQLSSERLGGPIRRRGRRQVGRQKDGRYQKGAFADGAGAGQHGLGWLGQMGQAQCDPHPGPAISAPGTGPTPSRRTLSDCRAGALVLFRCHHGDRPQPLHDWLTLRHTHKQTFVYIHT
ncbi:unnamed protein product [Protopolystoma xenopodis]|uniref:Uncharacterized protein n=1 Tax=Protopolystoma xenopodis TaxID=117903 RepID=A0A448XL92_9PLAT|nr:unnamed protein product [Protopolystoma xenopodis]